ncbi:MAG: hypothetical protein QME46_11265, partial [Thermoanaerobacteraceae bacterium]|nr:hypothetical protein [Thermoanaerobacteraceae bacterium]
MSWIAGVVVNLPVNKIDRIFDYVVPDEMEGYVDIGSRVVTSFKNNLIDGFVIEKKSTADTSTELKNIIDAV